MAFLQPDIITFNEIPRTNTWEMANFVAAYLPGYFLATNSATDGFIRSVIVSRYPIVRSKSWLYSSDLAPYGYTSNDFTRDLFEAEINVPNFVQHLHVFVAHLKAYADADSSARRAAEASAISNFFVNGFLTTNASHPYVLAGDMNEDVARPPSNSGHPIARLVNAATGLQLTTPTNPVTGKEFTYSIRATLNERFDYILPGAMLASNIAGSQVFRTDVLAPTPPGLQQFDDKTASDHLPVLMAFHNPYNTPYRLTSFARSNQTVRLTWQSALQAQYRVEASSNLVAWSSLASNLMANTTNLGWTGNVSGPLKFFRVYHEP
jgi:endonuclease/exonuclease/phosphatase family metal-dependent hydrolase